MNTKVGEGDSNAKTDLRQIDAVIKALDTCSAIYDAIFIYLQIYKKFKIFKPLCNKL